MRELTLRDARLAEVAGTLERFVAELPAGRVEDGLVSYREGRIRLWEDPRFEGTDGRARWYDGRDINISGWSPFSFASAFGGTVWRTAQGMRIREGEVVPRFVSRFYKHEINLNGGKHLHTHVRELGDEFWFWYFTALASNYFNGIVLYSVQHPFEHFLDYREFPEAGVGTGRERAETLDGLRRVLRIARSFGIKTFLHHYVSHFPAGLSRKHHLGLDDPSGGRLYGVTHPVVSEYSRYVYRRTLELLPELTGFYVCFDAVPNCAEPVRDWLYPEAMKAPTRPELVFDLWFFNSLPDMKSLVKEYPGKVRFAHRVMDHADVYYWPTADRRITEWKRALPEVEMMAMIGPCTTCARTQSRGVWYDLDFVAETIADAERKGADSISFQTVYELLSNDIDMRKIAGPEEMNTALVNRYHLDAVVDYVVGEPSRRSWYEAKIGRRLDLTPAASAAALAAIRAGSRISLLTYQQFFSASFREGHRVPERSNFYADPFFYPPMTFVDDEARLAQDLWPAWLNMNGKKRLFPRDVQYVIDFVDPSKPQTRRNPLVMARLLKKNAKDALRLAEEAAGSSPTGSAATILSEMTRLHHWGMRVQHEIHAAAGLYKAYFPKSKRQVLSGFRAALAELQAIRPHVRENDPHSARVLPLLDEFPVGREIENLKRLIRHVESWRCPFDAFALYCRSHREYNEIRRTVRPYMLLRPEDVRVIDRQLAKSIGLARRAAAELGECERSHRANVERWIEFLETEIAEMTPPAYEVREGRLLAEDDGFVQLWHDQCFRYGENCINDFDAFFTAMDFQRREPVYFRLTHGEEGLTLSVREEGVDVAAREAAWKATPGTVGDAWFARLWLDRAGDAGRMDIFKIHSQGRILLLQSKSVRGRQHITLWLNRIIRGGKARYRKGADWWRLDYTIPWEALGGRPARGEKWRANVSARASALRNGHNVWCHAYEMGSGKHTRLGTLTFA